MDGNGSKWSFDALKKKFKELEIDWNSIFDKIKDVIIKTIISSEPYIVNAINR
jgi:hypothetical protein